LTKKLKIRKKEEERRELKKEDHRRREKTLRSRTRDETPTKNDSILATKRRAPAGKKRGRERHPLKGHGLQK